MTIANIASFNQYAPGTSVAMNSVNVPKPYLEEVSYIWGGSYYNYMSANIEVPPEPIEKDGRGWLAIRPNASHGSTNVHTQLLVHPGTIRDELKTPGTTIRFGFKFASAVVATSGLYMGYRAPSATAVAVGTNLTAIAGVVTGSNQYHWIDMVFKYTEEGVDVSFYSDKELVHSFTATLAQHWALGVGNIARSLSNATNYNYGFFVNDFLVVVDREGEEPTGDIGPVTILPLAISEAEHNARWTSPDERSVQENLSQKLTGTWERYPDESLVRSDPYGGALKTKFAMPQNEDRKVLAFQQFFVGQKPASMGADFTYQFLKDNFPLSDKITYKTGVSLNAFTVHMPVVDFMKSGQNGVEEIPKYGMMFQSTRKVID